MNENIKSIIIFGAGYFGRSLIKALYEKWHIIVVDIKEEKLKTLKANFPNAEYIVGDASSILTWKKINLNNVFHIIITVKDADVSLEACRILTEVFELEIPTTVFLYDEDKEEKLKLCKNINIVKPATAIINTVLSLIEKNVKYASNIGLANKEIVEVNVLSRSNFVNKPLKRLRPSKWRVGAIYRNGSLVLPSGNEKIKVGDRVVLIGEPKVLDNIVNLLLKGTVQFPMQFGSNVALPYCKHFRYAVEETFEFIKNIKVDNVFIFPYKNCLLDEDDKNFLESRFRKKLQIKENIKGISLIFKKENNLAFAVIPYNNLSFFEKLKVKALFEKVDKPFLVSKGKYPYKKVIAVLNSEDPALALEVAVEISHMLNVDLKAIYTTMPKELRGEEEEEKLENVNSIVSDFENIYKKSTNFELLEGNPVKKTLQFLEKEKFALLVMSFKKQKISIFNSNIQYLIMKKAKNSSLLIPTAPIEELNE